jgi:hypothetical protein
LLTAAVATGVAYGPYVLLHAACLTGLGPWSTSGTEMILIVPFLAFAVSGGAVLGLLVAQTRRKCTLILAASSPLVLLCPPTVFVSAKLRLLGFRLASDRAAPLVEAIHEHARRVGYPPESLDQLVPEYLPSVPGRLPPIELVSGDKAREYYQGNPWVLTAIVSTGSVNWDKFLYFPLQNYPSTGYGGWLERIGDWAYVHE